MLIINFYASKKKLVNMKHEAIILNYIKFMYSIILNILNSCTVVRKREKVVLSNDHYPINRANFREFLKR